MTISKSLLALLLAAPLFVLGGCGSDGPMEDAGENIDNAVEDMGDEIEDATDR